MNARADSAAESPRDASRCARIFSFGLILAALVTVAWALLAASLQGAGEWPRSKAWFPVYVGVLVVALVAGLFALLRSFGRGARTTRVGAAQLRQILFLCVGATAVLHAFLQPYRGVYVVCTFGAASAGFLLLLPLAGLRRAPRWLRRTELVAFNLCLALLGGELALRAAGAITASPLLAQFDDGPEARMARFGLEPGSDFLGSRVNARGFADAIPRGDARFTVVAIGDSFSVGIVPPRFHYSAVAETEVEGLDVYNVGINGIGPAGYEWLLETEALPLEPDAILVAIFVGNDVRDAREHDELSGPARFARLCFDRRNLCLYMLPTRLVTLASERNRLALETDAGLGEAHLTELTQAPSVAEYQRSMPWLFDAALERPAMSAAGYFDMERARAVYACGADRLRYDAILEYLARMKRRVGRIPFFVLLIPDEFQVEDALWERILAVPGCAGLDRDLPQRLLAAWLVDAGIPCLDLLPVLRAEPAGADGARHLYHLQDSHFNRAGNEVAGKALARFLRARLAGG